MSDSSDDESNIYDFTSKFEDVLKNQKKEFEFNTECVDKNEEINTTMFKNKDDLKNSFTLDKFINCFKEDIFNNKNKDQNAASLEICTKAGPSKNMDNNNQDSSNSFISKQDYSSSDEDLPLSNRNLKKKNISSANLLSEINRSISEITSRSNIRDKNKLTCTQASLNQIESNFTPSNNKRVRSSKKLKILDKYLNDGITLEASENSDIQKRITRKLDTLQEVVSNLLEDRKEKRKRKNIMGKRSRVIQQRRTKAGPCVGTSQTIGITLETFYISSDEETKEQFKYPESEDLDPIVSVFVIWQAINKKIFKVRKFQPLSVIANYFGKEMQKDTKLMLFTLDENEINLNKNSYVSLRLSSDKVIEGGLLPDSYLDREQKDTYDFVKETGSIMLKIQSGEKRAQSFPVYMQKTDKMEYIFWQVCLELGKEVEDFKLYLDGKIIRPDSTLESLDLEDGDCIDIVT